MHLQVQEFAERMSRPTKVRNRCTVDTAAAVQSSRKCETPELSQMPNTVIITIEIGGESKNLADAEPDWITKSVNRQRREGEPVCVRVTIQEDGITLPLVAVGCGSQGGFGGGGGGKSAEPSRRQKEARIEWTQRGLDQNDIAPGSVVSFVRELSRIYR